jgi:hypothetical protein
MIFGKLRSMPVTRSSRSGTLLSESQPLFYVGFFIQSPPYKTNTDCLDNSARDLLETLTFWWNPNRAQVGPKTLSKTFTPLKDMLQLINNKQLRRTGAEWGNSGKKIVFFLDTLDRPTIKVHAQH